MHRFSSQVSFRFSMTMISSRVRLVRTPLWRALPAAWNLSAARVALRKVFRGLIAGSPAPVRGMGEILQVHGFPALRLAGFVALAGAGGLPGGIALGQVQAGGAPVGVMSYSAAEFSTTSLGVPLVRPSRLVRVVGAATATTVTLTEPDGGTVPRISLEPHYLEVLGHVDGKTTTLVGQRFEIDEAASSLAAPGTLVMEGDSLLNTSASTVIAQLVNYRVAIRPHWTLAALFGTGLQAKVNAAAAVAAADQVLAWDGDSYAVYYLRSGAVPQWRNVATGPTNQDQAIVPPGTGVFFRRQANALSFSVVGEVRVTPFARVPAKPAQLMATGFPVDASPVDWQMVGSSLTAGTSPATADQLLVWGDSAFQVFYLRQGSALEWRNVATGLTDYANAKLFRAKGAVLLRLQAGAAGTTPFPLVQPVPFSP